MAALTWGILGSLLATVAILVEPVYGSFRFSRPALNQLGNIVHFRRSKASLENLRQFLIFAGAALLLGYSLFSGNALYVGLQVLLVASAILWYVPFDRDEMRSEVLKSQVRLILALAVGIGLFLMGHVEGFHWIGILGLEVLGCGFVIARPKLLRDSLVLGGGLVLTLYGALGILWDAETAREGHLLWASLNGVYSVFAIVALIHTLREEETVS